jgi:hypothetical protein
MKIHIKPYGVFEIIKAEKASLKNCKLCWFNQQPEPIHCPEHIPCKGLYFVKFSLDKKIKKL